MLKDYLELCWFSGYPSELPTDRKFLWINFVVYLVLGLFIQANISDPVEAFIQVIIEIIITLLFIVSILIKDSSLYNFERFVIAILVCENFIYMLGLPLAFWFIFAKDTDFVAYPIYLGGGLIIWSMAIIAYLLKEMFDFNWKASASLSVVYFFLDLFWIFCFVINDLTG